MNLNHPSTSRTVAIHFEDFSTMLAYAENNIWHDAGTLQPLKKQPVGWSEIRDRRLVRAKRMVEREFAT